MWPVLLAYYAGVVAMAGVSLSRVGSDNYGSRKIVMFRKHRPLSSCHETVLKKGGRVVRELPLVHALAVRMPERGQSLEELGLHPDVLLIEDDFQVQTVALPAVRMRQREQTIPWGVERIGAPKAWQEAAGEKVKVAVLDTGIDAGHPDLKANIRGTQNIKFPGWQAGDGNGHGTHVAGIIAAVDNNFGVVGVAPRAEIYAVKIFNRRGNGYISDIIAGLDWALQNKMQVVNMSFGTTRPSQALEEAVRRCVQAGMVLVAAAGNEGKENSVMYPARCPGVIAVSAIDRKNNLASFSSRGSEVTVAAPGVDILSTYPGGKYRAMSGTSMACPHVAGVAALVLSRDGHISGRQVVKTITSTATRLPGLTPEEQGSGLVNASFLAAGTRFNDEAREGPAVTSLSVIPSMTS
ncbi:S8 family peptidase [Neomoorella mulderi]|uniref:Subtilisin E n=1 Tax=Moorella mulderi DSM 14980 TaxID=1122241 RepID=A0A151AWC9_9FIRM|nr:S8 family peptidase [Moorella mulderi]KYH31974.1 subtilisin E precursor [Moorella mulderi DSM 14980]